MNLAKLLKAFACELEMFQDFVTKLINESIPGMARELLPEWEADLGLPDSIVTVLGTDEERASALHAKYYGKYDGQSKQFYIDYAASMGATITVTEYTGSAGLFRVDTNRVDRMPGGIGIDGARLRSTTAKNKWIVTIYTIGEVTVQYLMQVFEELKPAHTQILWNDLT